MRVLVCGGRDFRNWRRLHEALIEVFHTHSVSPTPWTIIEGGAKGADFLAAVWGDYHGITVEEYPANWKRDGKAAGPIRNQRMIDEAKPDLVVAFPGGNGTADMIQRAQKAGIRVIQK